MLTNIHCTLADNGFRLQDVSNLGLLKSLCPDKKQPSLLDVITGPNPGSSDILCKKGFIIKNMKLLKTKQDLLPFQKEHTRGPSHIHT